MKRAIVFEVDAADRITSWPEDAADETGWPAKVALGRRWIELFGARSADGNRVCPTSCGFHEMASRGETIEVFEVLATLVGGEEERFFGRAEALRAGSGSGLRLSLWSDRRHGSADREHLPAAPGDGQGRPLSERETEVLRLLSRGHRAEAIAKRMGIAVATVRNHVQHAVERLGASSRTEAVALAIRRRLI